MQKKLLTLFVLTLALTLQAQIPSGYYNAAKGKKGQSLKTALCDVIYSHTTLSYNSLWEAYKTTDLRPDGKIWDMYSDNTNYDPDRGHSGNYSGEGDMFNREHSVPQSWFKEASPMRTDLFHVIPTDGYINGRRSNNPYGEVSNPTYTSHNGFSKLGPCSTPGYSGTVFEPNDEYKGDFARIYFYMVTCYENQISSWNSPMLAGNKYPGLSSWALTMLLRWAKEDPISQKEIDRNNNVYKLQKNRNPFIDFPKLEEYIWGTKQDSIFDPNKYNGQQGDDTNTPPAAPTFSIDGGNVAVGTQVVISCATEGAMIYYNINNSAQRFGESPVTVTINYNCTVNAYASANGLESPVVSKVVLVSDDDNPNDDDNPQSGSTIYGPVSSTNDLEVGKQYVLTSYKYNTAMGNQSGNVRSRVDVSIMADSTIDIAKSQEPISVLTLGGSAGAWTFYIASESKYLSLDSDANALGTDADATTSNSQWNISFNADNVVITNKAYDERFICYNSSSPRFATYKSSSRQNPIWLYKQVEQPVGIGKASRSEQPRQGIYDLQGRRLERIGKPGIYIVNGRKVLVR